MKLSIIIPLYNEKEFIQKLLLEIDKVTFPDFVEKKEVIIVDDASEDNSVKIVEEYISDKKNYILIKNKKNSGKGASVKKGIQKASGDVFMIQDADMELTPKDIPRMLSAMNDLNVEFINGSRYLHGIIRPLSSYKRYVINRLFTFTTSILLNVKLTDMACGHKLIHRNLYEKLNLNEKRFGFEAELIIKALRVKKNNIAEVPVQYFPRNLGEGKKFKNIDALKILWIIFIYGILKKA
ncbi:MAG: glycosyltransferase family 2 protein [Chlorobi bacterium]|nr:glycosyltransferase family 2 protein [Chlorobiota bacterium]